MPETATDHLEPLLDRQKQAWLGGGRPAVEALLAGGPLAGDPEALLDLIYNEVVVREELGEAPAAEEYAARYPHLRRDLELHFEVHRLLDDGLLAETPRLAKDDTLPEGEAPSFERGSHPPDYEVVGVLGQGGMGVVYRARHRRLRRHVALKMFRPGRPPTPREVMRFRAEAEAVARLQHPNVVQIFEVGEWDGLPYLALELAGNGTLADKLQRLPSRPAPPPRWSRRWRRPSTTPTGAGSSTAT